MKNPGRIQEDARCSSNPGNILEESWRAPDVVVAQEESWRTPDVVVAQEEWVHLAKTDCLHWERKLLIQLWVLFEILNLSDMR